MTNTKGESTMSLKMASALFLLSGCCGVSDGIPAGGDRTIVGDWVRFEIEKSSFQIQRRMKAIDGHWMSAERQCLTEGWRLPTIREWLVARAGEYYGMEFLGYPEWYHDPDGTTGVFDVGADTHTVVPVVDTYVGFRCVRDP